MHWSIVCFWYPENCTYFQCFPGWWYLMMVHSGQLEWFESRLSATLAPCCLDFQKNKDDHLLRYRYNVSLLSAGLISGLSLGYCPCGYSHCFCVGVLWVYRVSVIGYAELCMDEWAFLCKESSVVDCHIQHIYIEGEFPTPRRGSRSPTACGSWRWINKWINLFHVDR